jgi:hypothetical protein
MVLEGAFDAHYQDFLEALTSDAYSLANNLCRRMGDIEWYATQLAPGSGTDNLALITPIVPTLLVGYFSTCKSLLDAAAISLTTLLSLRLAPREMDFSKAAFWRALKGAHPDVERRYRPLHQGLTRDVVHWRDASVHRTSPFVASGLRDADVPSTGALMVHVLLEPGADVRTLAFQTAATGALPRRYVDPLYFHRLWRPQFLALCAEACHDIAENL